MLSWPAGAVSGRRFTRRTPFHATPQAADCTALARQPFGGPRQAIDTLQQLLFGDRERESNVALAAGAKLGPAAYRQPRIGEVPDHVGRRHATVDLHPVVEGRLRQGAVQSRDSGKWVVAEAAA